MNKFKIQNVSEEEFSEFLKSIGGLESGWGERYWGDNKLRKWLFNVINWFIWKLPYFQETKKFSKKNSFHLFIRNNIFYWLLKPILKDRKPKNPLRNRIYSPKQFEINSGWYGLVKNLIEEITLKGWNKEVCQVKEKFAGLRFYINGASDEIHDIIEKYENISYHICEECGEDGKVRDGGWIRTLCDKHNK